MPLDENDVTHNLTVDELTLVETLSRRYARQAARQVLRRYVRGGVIAWLVLAIGIGAAIDIQQHDSTSARDAIVHSGRTISVAGCNRDYTTISALRGILQRGKAQVVTAERAHRIPLAEANQAKRFYDESLASLSLPDCRAALTILTDDPSRLGAIPKPRYVKPQRK